MPYILNEDRTRLWQNGKFTGNPPKSAGELNYVLTMTYLNIDWKYTSDLIKQIETLVYSYFDNSEKRYQNHNDVMGALYGSLCEYARRFSILHGKTGDIEYCVDIVLNNFYKQYTGPYENLAIEKNGDLQ